MGEMQLDNHSDLISSLHAIEHLGLGQRNYPIGYKGYLKELENLRKMLKAGR